LRERWDSIANGWPDNAQDFVDWIMPYTDEQRVVRAVDQPASSALSASPRDFRRQMESVFLHRPG
jgi:hypothetical protein